MQRSTLSIFKVYAIPAYITLLAFIVKSFSLSIVKSPYLAGWYGPLSWGSLGLLGVGMLWALAASYRVWRWAEGRDPACYCGGILGFVRDSVHGRSGYRKCLGCGKNHPVSDY